MYDDLESFLENLLSSRTSGNASSSVRTAKQRIRFGEDPLVAARDFETAALARDWKPGRIARGVRRIARQPVEAIDPSKYTYGSSLIERTYQDLFGRAPTESEIQENLRYAGAKRIQPGDVGAFESLINTNLLSSREGMAKIKTPEDIEYERKFGPIPRINGELQRGMVVFRPEKIQEFAKSLPQAPIV